MLYSSPTCHPATQFLRRPPGVHPSPAAMQPSRKGAAALHLLCLLLAAGACRGVTVTDSPAAPTSTTASTATPTTSTTPPTTTPVTPTPPPSPSSSPSLKRAVASGSPALAGASSESGGGASGSSEQDAESQERVAILKQINRHNDDGSYTFGYEAADGSFKIETRDVLGNVKGMFGFVDEAGQLKRVAYSASNGTGFRSTDGAPAAAATAAAGSTTAAPQSTLYHQIIRPSASPTTRRPSLRYYGLRTHPPPAPGPVSTAAPLHAPASDEDAHEPSERPSVIQRIRRPHIVPVRTERPEAGSTTRRPHLFLPSYLRPLGQPVRIVQPNGQEGTLPVTVPRLAAATFGHYPLPPGAPPISTTARPDPRRVVFVTRKPVPVAEDPELSDEDGEEEDEGEDDEDAPSAPERTPQHAKAAEDESQKPERRRGPKGNALRRQLGDDRLLGPLPRPPVVRVRQPETDDHADVYGGGPAAGNVRPVPDTPFRGYFTSQPRIVQSALLQGFGAARHRAGVPPPPPGAPLSPADLVDTRNAAGVRLPVPVPTPGPPDASAPAPQYVLAGQDVQQQLHQLLLAQQQRYRPPPPPPPQPTLTPFQQAIMQTLLGGELPPELLRELLQPSGHQGYHNPQHQPQPQYQPQPHYPPQAAYPPQQPYPPQAAYPPQAHYPQHYPSGYPTGQYPSPPQSPVPYPPQMPHHHHHYHPQQSVPHQAMAPYAPPQSPPPTPPPPPPPPPPTAPLPYQPQYPPPMPYSHPLPYEPQQYQPVQFPAAPASPTAAPAPAAGYGPAQGQVPYHLQRRLRYRPRPGYITPPGYYPQQAPFSLRLPIPVYPQPLPFDSPQVQYSGAGGSRVGTPSQLMPAEYRDALLLRMLLAIRADQEQRAQAAQHAQHAQAHAQAQAQAQAAAQHARAAQQAARPVATLHAAAAAAEAEAAAAHDAAAAAHSPRALQYHVTTTARPRPPMRSVQILDPVSEPPAKRSPDNSTATP